jgi:membrane-bound lytic murein transglycosylase MltF
VPTVFEKVGKKEVEFTIADTDIAMYNIKQNKALAAAFPIGDMDKLGWATAKTSTGLKEAIDAFFDKQMKSKESETQKIWKKYYGVTLNDFANVVSQVK